MMIVMSLSLVTSKLQSSVVVVFFFPGSDTDRSEPPQSNLRLGSTDLYSRLLVHCFA